MEIKRQIVESASPPNNKEVWWLDTNDNILKRFADNNWIIAINQFDTDGRVVKTTYEKAKALYESGQMIPGVYYNFKYNHLAHIQEMKIISNEIDLNVYIDKSGNLKANGTYFLGSPTTPEVFMFTSDYTFNIKYITTDVLGLLPFRDTTLYLPNATNNLSYINTIEEFLKDNKIRYYKSDFSDYENAVEFKIKNCVPIIEYEEEDFSTEIYIFDNGANMRINTYSSNGEVTSYQITINDESVMLYTYSEGYLYNLDFGNYRHSHVVDGHISEVDMEYGDCIVKANVINDQFDIVCLDPIYIQSGTIINSLLSLEQGVNSQFRRIYIVNTHLLIDIDHDNIILGDKYYDESVFLSGIMQDN